MLEVLTPLGTLAGLIIAGIMAYRSERNTRKATQQTEKVVHDTSLAAAEVARTEKAKQEYIDILEKEQLIVKAALSDALLRISKLEASEEICQQERAALVAENSRLRRQMEAR